MRTINITLDRKQYDGAEGTSLTVFRGQQMNDVLDLLNASDVSLMDYKGLQEYTEKHNVMGASKVRTLFPLLMKVGFCVDYTQSFNPKELFTNSGKAFIKICDSLALIEKDPEKDSVKMKALKEKFENLKKALILDGVKLLYSNYPEHRLVFTMDLWSKIGVLSEMEYYYALSIKDECDSIDEICECIRQNRLQDVEYCCDIHAFSYQRSLLIEAGIVNGQLSQWNNNIIKL